MKRSAIGANIARAESQEPCSLQTPRCVAIIDTWPNPDSTRYSGFQGPFIRASRKDGNPPAGIEWILCHGLNGAVLGSSPSESGSLSLIQGDLDNGWYVISQL
jgi:hypothetical protein